MKGRVFIIRTIVAFFCFAQLSPAQASSVAETVIKGFAQWNASRVERIVLDNGLKSAADDAFVIRFFPSTSRGIKTYHFSRANVLLPLIQDSIQIDMEKFEGIVDACIPAQINRIAEGKVDPAVLATSLHSLTNLKNSYSIDEFIMETCDGISLAARIDIKIKDKTLIHKLSVTSAAALASGANDYNEYIEDLAAIILYMQSISDYEVSYASRVHYLLTGLDRIGQFSEKDYPTFSKFQNLALFFASLADAGEKESSDAVTVALDNYVDSLRAYSDKREPGGIWSSYYAPVHKVNSKETEMVPYYKWTRSIDLYLSSYYGGAGAYIRDESDWTQKQTEYRFFGPVGFELKIARVRGHKYFFNAPGTFSINYAPFDIGAYVTNELVNEEYTASFKDILAPSVFLSFSMQNFPVSYLVGYQKNIKLNESVETEGPFFAITFDLPVMKIF